MSKTVYIKLTRTGPTSGPFTIYDQWGNIIAEGVSRNSLIDGVGYMLEDDVTMIRLVSTGECSYEKAMPIVSMTNKQFFEISPQETSTGCLWRHLTDPVHYNYFYGNTAPYVLEHPFSYEYYDEIVQNVKDFTRVYRYVANIYGSFIPPDHIELDNEWFNNSIVYNGQQCSGLLELVAKPSHNLSEYMSYPRYNSSSKTITYTKSDSWYQYNTFWDVVKDKTQQIFTGSCESRSIDKELNQSNMDYGYRSFTKAPIRGKDTKIRHILNNKSDIHLVSRFIYAPAQISYK